MKLSILLILLFCSFVSFSQFHNLRSKSEFGFLIGGSYYHGDLNQFMPYRDVHLSVGLVYRYNLHSRTSVRANLTYGKISGNDANSKELVNQDRNLSFTNQIFEFGAGVEFNYFPFQLGHDRYKGTAYVLAELAIFRMNPKAITDDGNEVDLQPLGTEGQGTTLNSKDNYNLTQLSIPLGVGCKLSLGKMASINFEFGIRKTFTDYLDDVGSGSYVDPTELAALNGPLAAEMSNRSLSGSRYGKRGNSNTNDWYVFSGMMLTFRLGQPTKCWSR